MTEEAVEAVARAMEPKAFKVFDQGHTVQNYFAKCAFLNAEKIVKRARKKAALAIAAMPAREPGRDEVLEEAAKVVDDIGRDWRAEGVHGKRFAAEYLAASIRSLKRNSP